LGRRSLKPGSSIPRGPRNARQASDRAEKLSRLLSDQAAAAAVDVDGLGDDQYIEDYLVIERVGPGVLWFEGGMAR
jgi:hypothetical protein